LTQAAHPELCQDPPGAQGQRNHLLMQRIHKLPNTSQQKMASVTINLFAFESQGKPLGHDFVRNGFGPGCNKC
jgi:hypothetical protein